MAKTVLVLGANGRFGRAATQAFLIEGWRVRTATRSGAQAIEGGATAVKCDVMDRAAVVAAAQGADVIVHAVNPAYHHWAKMLPVLTGNIISAGLSSGATVMIPGNVYPFGAHAREMLTEQTPFAPTSRKGVLRVQMEGAFAQASRQGLRTVILRGGDFIERRQTGNWFDSHITNKVGKGRFTYPGRMDAVHAWAYLPDMARAMALLAARRHGFAPFATFGFEGYSLTGSQLCKAVERAVGRSLRPATMPWGAMRMMGVFSPLMREVLEMRYLWDTPHRIDGAPLQAILPEFQVTPVADALAEVLIAARADAGLAPHQRDDLPERNSARSA